MRLRQAGGAVAVPFPAEVAARELVDVALVADEVQLALIYNVG